MIDIKMIAHEAFDEMAKKLFLKYGKVAAIEFASLWREGKYVLQPKRIQRAKDGKYTEMDVGSWGTGGGNTYEVDVEKLKEEKKNDE